jgi:putative transposase
VHIAVTIPPTLMISTWIGQLKGGSSHAVNQQVGLRQKALHWQIGYGVVSSATGDLDWATSYVRNQKEHHVRRGVHQRLKRLTHDDDARGDSAEAGNRKGP